MHVASRASSGNVSAPPRSIAFVVAAVAVVVAVLVGSPELRELISALVDRVKSFFGG